MARAVFAPAPPRLVEAIRVQHGRWAQEGAHFSSVMSYSNRMLQPGGIYCALSLIDPSSVPSAQCLCAPDTG